jgi:hemolysin activation/secretion protein
MEKSKQKRLKQEEQKQNIQISKSYFSIDTNASHDQGECFPVDNILIVDNKVISTKNLLPIFSPYEHQCLNQANISNLINKINNAYIQKGYITSRAYLKEQDLSTKILKIHIQEGKIEDILLNKRRATEIKQTFSTYKDKVFNLRDMEMGLEHFNRLNTATATIDLMESDKVGYSLVNINKEQDKHFFTTLTIANSGSESTGEDTIDLKLYIEDILGVNSQIILGLSGTLERREEKRTTGRSISWNIPYGYYMFSAGYREFLHRSTIKGEHGKYVSSGTSSTYFANLDYTFHRDDKSILKTNIGLDIKQNINFIANEAIKTSSSKLTVANIGISGSTTIGKTYLTGAFSVRQGLDWFDAFKDRPTDTKKAQFTAYTLDITADTPLTLFDTQFNLSNTFSAQYSNDKLYSAELFSIGGLYTVRGFKYMGYSGEIGALLRNELSLTKAVKIFDTDMLATPFIGLDIGAVEYDADIYKYMVGSAIGLKLKTQYLSMDFTLGVPLYAYDPIAEKNTVFSFSVTHHY